MTDDDLRPYADPSHPYNGSEYHTGEPCIEGCGNPAGTWWSPLWCFPCNVERMDRIQRDLEALIRGLYEGATDAD